MALAVVGHAATARRVFERIQRCGASLDTLFTLGLLGIPKYARPLLDAMRAEEPAIRSEAIRGMYLMTGRMFVEGGAPAEDGRNLVPAHDTAEAFVRTWSARESIERFHLGDSLSRPAPDGPPSARLLRAILTGSPRELGVRSLPGLFDGRARGGASLYSIALPGPWLDIKQPRAQSLELPVVPRSVE